MLTYRPKSVRFLAPIVGVFALLFLQAGVNRYLTRGEEVLGGAGGKLLQAKSSDFQQNWDPKVFRVLTFGHVQAAVDWYWLQLLLDGAMDKVKPGVHPPFYRVAAFITELDPAFFQVYYYSANILTVIRDDGEGARSLLYKAKSFIEGPLKNYPLEFQDSQWRSRWTLYMLLGYVELFDFGNMPEASRAFLLAAAAPHAVPFLSRLADRLKVPGGEYEVGVKLLQYLATRSSDPRVKERYLKQRASLYVSQYFYELNRLFREELNKTPQYRAHLKITPAELQRHWRRFMKESRSALEDPWGGKISLSPEGKIVTTTPHERVFGLD